MCHWCSFAWLATSWMPGLVVMIWCLGGISNLSWFHISWSQHSSIRGDVYPVVLSFESTAFIVLLCWLLVLCVCMSIHVQMFHLHLFSPILGMLHILYMFVYIGMLVLGASCGLLLQPLLFCSSEFLISSLQYPSSLLMSFLPCCIHLSWGIVLWCCTEIQLWFLIWLCASFYLWSMPIFGWEDLSAFICLPVAVYFLCFCHLFVHCNVEDF